MSELQKRLDKLILRLDHMGLTVQKSVVDAIQAVKDHDLEAGRRVEQNDTNIDREEVEIEQECIRLLALYQPAAIDLRTICMIIKVNNDLERIADKAASMGGRIKHVVAENIVLGEYPGFQMLTDYTLESLRRMTSMLGALDAQVATGIIEFDKTINQAYKNLVRNILDSEAKHTDGTERAMTMILLARALERTADLCVNVAEEIIFLRTGEIVRHRDAFPAPH